tara:strand:- start:7340 stop:7579 length:240 start_codon:yes stop_codon:yes gene_type:complete
MTLFELKAGQSATIASLGATRNIKPSVRRNLLALGVIPQTQIKMIRKAPLGASIEISVRGSLLCVGQDLANLIEVKSVF